ncbi:MULTISPECIES: acyl-CoA-binding protein [Tenacibaculum]|uniref:Acyl-CoA-binding protein n=1 Tax=Tenacibaculum discolor TaxID=361581 RepID=A0A2G1BRE1_9FLAO|nr:MULTISPECIES: acyl-CoA-binding protein [Tenacibaculum]PHO00806.1 phosphatidylserine decarboxylase [Rhodobacteraceae bacterium 4F10]MDP2540972.1 acyl-CoA-binding protein [Tenacibaculum discolor]NVK07865.1 acyl-CoA-binding protein [Tenacibaculum sp.]PHN96419.1 phosphatidylserine decarboxylase [Tenacibaculum discolor]RLK00129.1 acyl-CoA-binding protein [Tenacibaculum discolor]
MEDNLDLKFKEAYQKASGLEEKLPPDVMLRLYAYYKQAVKGDRFTFNDNSDLRNAFKFNAWMQLRGMSEREAKKEYIKLVNSIIK